MRETHAPNRLNPVLLLASDMAHKNVCTHDLPVPSGSGSLRSARRARRLRRRLRRAHQGQKSHSIVTQALQLLINLLHRGACGCEVNTGDGAGILLQMPDRFLRREASRLGISLPAERGYGAGLVFLPRDPAIRDRVEAIFEQIVIEEGQIVLGWRDVPTDDRRSVRARSPSSPSFKQLFVGRGPRHAGARRVDSKATRSSSASST